MYDILRCRASPEYFGFSKFYFFDDVKDNILTAENVTAAVEFRNKKSLITLKDFEIDEGALVLIAEKRKLCFLIDLSLVIKTYGVKRAIALSQLRKLLHFCNKYGIFYAIATFAEDEFSIRSPKEIEAICSLLDLNPGQVKFASEILKEYLPLH